MDIRVRTLARGALSSVPGLKGVGVLHATGANSASYYYGVWLKHLAMLWEVAPGYSPRTVAELGPGDSLGTGLAAMLSGADHYLALDVIVYNNVDYNLRIFEELVELFSSRAPRPTKGWPDFDPLLDENLFPSTALSEERLRSSLAPERLERIREAIGSPDGNSRDGSISVNYIVPWSESSSLRPESVDLAISHSVMEHVDEVDLTYAAVSRCLKPGAYTSHQIDFSAHGMSTRWNGYRTCPEWIWRIARGRRPFFINREPPSRHIQSLRSHGLQIVRELFNVNGDGVGREELAPRWRALSDQDLSCMSMFVQARKPS